MGQDCYTEEKGAFTGAVSMGMIKSMGCTYALAGHSERRTVFGENDEDINAKVRVILDSGLKCILCVGEVKEEYEMGLNKEVCAIQLAKCLTGVSEAELSEVVIAYEPVWAIGTGLTATPEIAEDVHKYIRSWFEKTYSPAAAAAMRIQYGGSVTPDTVDELMSQPNIDGALVGGASLLADKFSRIMNYEEFGSADAASSATPAPDSKPQSKRQKIKDTFKRSSRWRMAVENGCLVPPQIGDWWVRVVNARVAP